MANETPRRHPQVIHVEDVEAIEPSQGKRFGAKIRQLGAPTGAKGVGCNWFEVAPGRAAFPYHFHCAIEEALFVLEGTGTLRIGNKTVTLGPGDYVTCPSGPDYAHQLTNTGEGPLRYLCISNKANADVVGYPDSKKIGALGSPSPNYFDPPWVRAIFREGDQVDYYDGEDVD